MSDRSGEVRWRWRFLVLEMLLELLRRIGFGDQKIFVEKIEKLRRDVERGES